MAHRTVMFVVLVSLVAVSAWAQALTEPAGPGPKPAMIVAGRALTPSAFAESLRGDTVRLDGVEMLWVGAAAKSMGGSATIEDTPEGRMLHVRSGMRTLEFVILPPGEFWRHPWVRQLIVDAGRYGIYQLQPLPRWPYEEANIPARPPYGVDWKRPYLEWRPDEAWLLLHLEPPPPPEPTIVVAEETEKESKAAEEEAAQPEVTPTPAPTAGPAEPGMMGPEMMGPGGGPEPGMAPPGGPGAPGAPTGPEMEPDMMAPPPPPPG